MLRPCPKSGVILLGWPHALPQVLIAACGAVIDEVRKRGDSCGGEVTCVIRACPKGLGSPVFDKLEAELAKALMSLPASKVSPRILEQKSEPSAVLLGCDVCMNGPAAVITQSVI